MSRAHTKRAGTAPGWQCPGYETDGYFRGPAGSAWVKFKSGGTELTVTAKCAGGRPQFTTAPENRGGGGGEGA